MTKRIPVTSSKAAALLDFERARRQATLERILARLTGEPAQLLPFEEVRQKLREEARTAKGLQDIALDDIVGSVGRYEGFTRRFFPLSDGDAERWARVKVAATGMKGLPPINVYKVGDAYFVRDGHHRVSVARQLGATHIQAYVTEVRTKVPLSPDVKPDDLIVKAEHADFLEHTNLDEIRPEADLSVSVPGQYEVLEEHIAVHRYFMGLERGEEIPYQEAVAHWYDEVYSPVVAVFRESDILRDFPGRTETDLYLWVSEHRAELQEELGWEIEPGEAAADLASRFSPKPLHRIARLGAKVASAIVPDELEPGPAPGEWRGERRAVRRDDRLFADSLVAISGDEAGWLALEQALVVARREEGKVRGLHVLSSEAQRDSDKVVAIREEFSRRCEAAGVEGELAFDVGQVSEQVCERARWVALAVVGLSFPPSPQPLARLGSGFRAIVQRCPVPVLATRRAVFPLERALLAYDGSLKAGEALFVSAYLVGQWGISLTVVTVMEEGRVNEGALKRAREYLATRGVQAVFERREGLVAEGILRAAGEYGSDLVIMGGYGFGPVLHIVLGSAVDQVLRQGRCPILICR